MAASHLETSLSLCVRQMQKTLHERQGATSLSSCTTRQERSFPIRGSSRPISSVAAPSLKQQVLVVDKEKQPLAAGVSTVEIRTLRNCRLGIAMYPDFLYNAEGGGGPGSAEELSDGKLSVEFDIERLYIPAVEGKTTRFLGLPLPPFLCIKVVPQSLKGFIDRSTGKVELNFSANFLFSVGSLYSAPPLVVNTLLTTETTTGRLRSGHGKRLDAEGKCKLVGVAPLVPIEDAFMNVFLTLPTDCLASMEAQFKFAT